jgi:hypothetical protein
MVSETIEVGGETVEVTVEDGEATAEVEAYEPEYIDFCTSEVAPTEAHDEAARKLHTLGFVQSVHVLQAGGVQLDVLFPHTENRHIEPPTDALLDAYVTRIEALFGGDVTVEKDSMMKRISVRL